MASLKRPRARKQISCMLFVAVSLLFCCCAAAERRCGFDRIAKKVGRPLRATVLKLPRRGQSGVQLLIASESEWKPIRISVFTEDLKDYLSYCTAVGQLRPNFEGGSSSCSLESILTKAKKSIILNHVLPRATKLHTERLLVQPLTNPIVVSDNMYGICFEFTIPRSHFKKGVKNADMLLYVAAGPTESATVAWAIPCADLDDQRPIVGVMNFNPAHVSSQESLVRAAAHEIAHTLGFVTGIFLYKEMVWSRTGVRGKPSVHMLETPKVVEKARIHYNCPTAPGMELEDQGQSGSPGSHWERRNAKDELMAPITGAGYYTALTMAAFEDLGFYRANWSMAETMNWGRNAGCDFLEKKCVINGSTAYPDMFCTSTLKSNDYYTCTSDRLELGKCYNYENDEPLPLHFQYFNDTRLGAEHGFTDHCPYIKSTSTACVDGVKRLMRGSRLGLSSRCLKGDNLYYNGTRIGDVCAEVQCNKNGTVNVRYLGNDTWHACPEGESIEPMGLLKGKIVCPKYYEVCYETGRKEIKIDLGSTKVDISDKDIKEEHGNVTHGNREFPNVDEVVEGKTESTATEYATTNGGSDNKNNPFADVILNKSRSNDKKIGNRDISAVAGFHAFPLLFLTAVVFAIA